MDSTRRVEPELLDVLSAADPRAIRSRRDLARVNALMANAGIVARELRAALPPGARRIAEIGAGDGVFAARLAGALAARGDGSEFTLVDRQQIVAAPTIARFAARGWRVRVEQADVFEWLRGPATPAFDAIVANLFLHHFEPSQLAELLMLVSGRTRVFVACEPRRSTAAWAGARLLGLVGCNEVTLHDAVISVRAGFRDRELAALWPGPGRDAWILQERPGGLFSHSFVARRP
jgi:protein-L-isoaspartate O-methyltransferase